ncbi:MAG: hypothetical protein ACJA2M_002710 [Polaribacter sp.]|jgi:hypothetical protein
MVNEAAVKVPVVLGKVTPAVLVLVPAGAIITVPAVPAVPACTATFPKFMSNAFAIAIGAIIVAVTVEVAVACAKVLIVKPAVKRNNNLIFFIMTDCF